MPKTLTVDDAKQSLNTHVAIKGDEIREMYGPEIGWEELLKILLDRSCVRYPCEIRFEAEPLLPGEFAHPITKGDRPEDGFTLYVHPTYASQLSEVPYLALYQLVLVNYGEFASPEDAETFGSHALGLDREGYYEALCRLADQLPGKPIGGCH